MRQFAKLLTMILVLFLISCADTLDSSEKYNSYSAAKIYWQGVEALRKSNYKDAIEKFEALDARYPFGEYAEKEQLYVIYAYYKDGDFPESLASTERFIHLHPDSRHADYAYYMKAVMNYEQNWGVFERYFRVSRLELRDLDPAKESYILFATLVHDYPDSVYKGNAVKYMTYIRNMLAQQYLSIAQFYLDRKAYIAAANRANQVITEYDGAPAVEAALHVAVKAYHQMHMDEVADIYQSVLDLNFPAE